jgi:hypothetical protein
MLVGLKKCNRGFSKSGGMEPATQGHRQRQALFLRLSRVAPRHDFPQHLFVLVLLNRVLQFHLGPIENKQGDEHKHGIPKKSQHRKSARQHLPGSGCHSRRREMAEFHRQ